jgi:hypothetical protein
MAVPVENSVKGFFKLKRPRQPFLAPLRIPARFPRLPREALERVPASAAPVAVTLLGGIVLVAVLATLPGPATENAPQPEPAPLASEEQVRPVREEALAPEPEPEPDDAAAATASDLPAFEPDANPDADPDLERTASILPALPMLPGSAVLVPPVAVAETEDEVAVLEEIQRREVEADVGLPSGEATASIGQEVAPSMRAAIATNYVNMRAGPDDDAEVLVVVPALAEIEAEEDCNWCAVVFDGREGYIYRSFISYAD